MDAATRKELVEKAIKYSDKREHINGYTAYLTCGEGFARVELAGTSLSTTTFAAYRGPLTDEQCHSLATDAYYTLLTVLQNYDTPAVPPLYPHPNG